MLCSALISGRREHTPGGSYTGARPLLGEIVHYGATDRLAILEELRGEASKRGWWSTARLPEWLASYVALEAEATVVRSLELELIPGLLQTQDYARELHVLRGALAEGEIDRRVAARARRQESLTAENPLQLFAIVSESALQRCAARPDDVAIAQLEYLHHRAQLPNVHLQILPFELGRHSGMSGAFTLLSFPEQLLPDIGWQEYALGGHVIDDESSVASLDRLFTKIRGQALGVHESLTRLADLVEHTQ
ncbi:MAG: DUF5753 domain-containing protein [Pseudonocardiales bacterium]